MNSNRIWVFGAVAVIIGLLAATWFLGVSPQLSLAALSVSDRVATESLNVTQETTLAKLKADFEGIDALNDELDAAHEVVPSDKSQQALISELGSIAKSNKVTIDALAFSEPVPYVPGGSVDPEVIAAEAAVSSGNFVSVPLAMSVSGSYGNIMSFVDDVQHAKRLVLVHDLTLGESTGESSSGVTFAIAADTFVLLSAADMPAPVEEAPVAGTEDSAATTAE